MQLESMEPRMLMDAQEGLYADIRLDTDRNGVINKLDNQNEDVWKSGKTGRGALILPNLDRDNTTTNAPDNWTGGIFNRRAAAPNHVIDNTADLADIGWARLSKLDTDSPYNYTVTVRLIKPARDPAWFKNVPAQDRLRLFMPTRIASKNNTLPQAGDVAVIGPGLGDTIRFTANPAAANEYSISDLAGAGGFYFGVEGIKSGANARIEVTLEYTPIIADGPLPEPEVVNIDIAELKVAPFVLLDNRQRASRVIVDDLSPYGLDNAALRTQLKEVFGTKLIESNSGDLWQQDGYEIGYVKAPYGQMPVVLELPRSRDYFFSTDGNMRSFIRGRLLKAGIGVNTDLAASPVVDSSTYGGDIESIAKPDSRAGDPGYLLMSNMPAYMKNYFAAQGVNQTLDLPLEWLGVNHVDEVVQMSPGGKVLIADPDLAWALLLWAVKLNPDVRMHAGMNGNEYLSDYTKAGIKGSVLANNAKLRSQNLEFVQRSSNLGGVYKIIHDTLKLQSEVSTPTIKSTNTGSATLHKAGAFTQLLGDVRREFNIRFTGSTTYQLRYRDGRTWSKWFAGSKSKDEVFIEAKAYLFKNYWSGTARGGDEFSFKSATDASLIKMPVLFASSGVLSEEQQQQTDITVPLDVRVSPFSINHVNSLVDGSTVVTGKAYGPKVNWNGRGNRDLFQDYATKVFQSVGYSRIEYAESALYHDSGGSLHCATNAIRELPTDLWWEAT